MDEPPPGGPTGPPPAGAGSVTADGAVCKLVLAPGAGELPPAHSRCLGEGLEGAGRVVGDGVERQCRPPPALADAPLSSPSPPVHYTAYLAATGTAFLRSTDEGRPGEPGVIVAGRGEERKRGGGAARCRPDARLLTPLHSF